MLKFVSSIGTAAYKTAAKTGLAAGSEMPPYPCALPLQKIEDAEDIYQIEAILDATFDAVLDLTTGGMKKLNADLPDENRRKGWKELDFVDSEGDMIMYTRPHVGPYNFAKATMTLDNIPASLILREMHAQNLPSRKRYSSAISEYHVVHRNPAMPAAFVGHDDDHLEELAERGIRDWHVETQSFCAPPPVAGRDFIILVEKRYVPETGKYYIYGTSVDFPEVEVKKSGYVRGIVMFGWEYIHTDDGMTHATYVSSMNPNGWAPTFLVGWMKTEIAKELQHSRRLLYEMTGRTARAAAKSIAASALAAAKTLSLKSSSKQRTVESAAAGATRPEQRPSGKREKAKSSKRHSEECVMQSEDHRMSMEDERLDLEEEIPL